jgi:hypothetical protein
MEGLKMFWTSTKLPLKEDERKWIEASLQWLIQQFGADYFLERRMILPESSFFPDKFHGTEECMCSLVSRVCGYMEVDPSRVEVEVFSDRDDTVSKHRLGGEQYSGAAGLYLHPAASSDRAKVSINTSQLNNPTALVATVAHELGHVILLGDGRLSRDDKSHEYMTDLLTVFLGLGIFTANAVVQFSQWQDHSHQGWSISRQGYMTEEMFGYSLAACAWIRKDSGDAWAKHLSVNVKHYFKTSLKYLEKGGATSLSRLRQ